MAFRPDRLAERMTALKLTQKELATAVGVSDRMIRDYKNGQSVPDGDHLARLVMALDTNVDYLFDWSDDPHSNLHLSDDERRFILWLRALPHKPTTEDTILFFASENVPRERHPRTKR